MIDARVIDNLPRILEGRMGNYGLGKNLLRESYKGSKLEAPEVVHIWEATFGFERVMFPDDEKIKGINILYMLKSPDLRPTFNRVANLLAHGRESRNELRNSMEKIGEAEMILGKGKIEGYTSLSTKEREDKMNQAIGERLVVYHPIRKTDVSQDEFYNALHTLGIRPLLFVSH